ncbi:MAG: hypothetical protein QXG16_04255 [Candidatus Anstonellaceae archaeon]
MEHIQQSEELLSGEQKDEKIEEQIKQKIKEYHYLITEEHARYLIMNEKKIVEKKDIKSAKNSIYPVELEGVVKKVYLTKKIEKNNKLFVSQRILLQDQSDEAIVLFFDLLAIEVANKIMTGDTIRIKPLRYINEEFRASGSTTIKVIKKAPLSPLKEGVRGNFEGEIIKIIQKKYKTQNGEEKKLIKITLKIGKKQVNVNIWEADEEIEKKLFEKSKIRIEGGIVKNGEINLNKNSRLLYIYLHKPKIELQSYQILENKVILNTTAGKLIFNNLEKFAQYIGLKKLAGDIELKKVLNIKLSNMIGSQIPSNYIEYLK